jgi:hypothetical protein
MLQCLAYLVFFGVNHVFLHLSWIGLFGLKSMYVHLETLKVEAVILPKLAHFSRENNVLVTPSSNTIGFFWEIHMLCQHSSIGPTRIKWAFSYLKIVIFRNYSFQKLTIFTVKQCPRCSCCYHTWISLRDTWVSSTQLNRPTWNIIRLSPQSNLWVQNYYFLKLLQLPQGKQCVSWCSF